MRVDISAEKGKGNSRGDFGSLAAERAGVLSASRKVFLDDTTNRDAILSQIDLAARDATRDGFAIAIGHPHPATIAALVEAVPRLEASGVRLVFVSQVLQ